ncbi:MAG: S1C family serine protease [Anaerolineae bacterium]
MRLKAVLGFLFLFSCSSCGLFESARMERWITRVCPTSTPVIIVVTPTPLPVEIVSSADAEEQLIINIYARVSPSVVYIQVAEQGGFFEEGAGSGFVYDKEGHIVTNHHLVENGGEILVTLADETTVPAQVVGTDPGSDLAVLKIEVPPELLYPVELGDMQGLRVGQRAIVIGNPFGLERTITTGVISSLSRTLSRSDSEFRIAGLIQTDAAINPGNSGGPVLDSRGRVIGVSTAIFTRTGISSGIGLAVPVDMVKKVVPALIATGHYAHPWLGISGQTITPAIHEKLGLPVDKGILVYSVERDGPAEKAGLRGGGFEVDVSGQLVRGGGDVILAINGEPLKKFDDLINFLESETSVGDMVELTILREGQELKLQATLTERPQDR